jgi:hypothetical protein
MSSALALARANLRYWPTVAPVVREQLERWEARAGLISDPRRRALALGKLRAERFNPQLAATLAAHAPRPRRRAVTEAIVALQVAYDYLDALEEQSPGTERGGERDDYARELLAFVRNRLDALPAAGAVAETLRRAGRRCARAQALSHAARGSDGAELRRWASEQAAGTSLQWPEWLAGAQASVLSLHALIAAAAEEQTSPAQAEALDRLYLSIGALTMLDSLIDREQDLAAGEAGYLRWYESPAQMGERLAAAVCDARRHSEQAPHGERHRVTLAGIVAYYGSAPQARDPRARDVFDRVNRQLPGQLAPVLAVMAGWRRGKRAKEALELVARRGRTRWTS